MGKNSKRRKEQKEARRFTQRGPRPGLNFKLPNELVASDDARTHEEWRAAEEAVLPPCPDCGAPYSLESATEEEWEDESGQGESLIYSCETSWAAEEGRFGGADHPRTDGIYEISRLIRRFSSE